MSKGTGIYDFCIPPARAELVSKFALSEQGSLFRSESGWGKRNTSSVVVVVSQCPWRSFFLLLGKALIKRACARVKGLVRTAGQGWCLSLPEIPQITNGARQLARFL